ncbi:Retrovirus-related Pol polyprotein from transposon RE1, partial [Linum grandiflorum]
MEVGSGRMIGKLEVRDGLYVIKTEPIGSLTPKEDLSLAYAASSSSSSMDSAVLLWHFRLGHPSFMYLERIAPQLFQNKKAKFFNCEVCQLAKHTRTTYSPLGYRPTKPFAIIHSDIWGPTRVKNVNGARWFVLFIDEHTRMTWTFLMKDKSETASVFQTFYHMIRTQFQ